MVNEHLAKIVSMIGTLPDGLISGITLYTTLEAESMMEAPTRSTLLATFTSRALPAA
jgi:hypothetical protein